MKRRTPFNELREMGHTFGEDERPQDWSFLDRNAFALKDELVPIKRISEEEVKAIFKMKSKIRQLEDECNKLKNVEKNLKKKVGSLMEKKNDLESLMTNLKTNMKSSPEYTIYEESNKELMMWKDKVNQLTKQVSLLHAVHDDSQRITKEMQEVKDKHITLKEWFKAVLSTQANLMSEISYKLIDEHKFDSVNIKKFDQKMVFSLVKGF